MAFTEDEFKALQLLLREEIREQLTPIDSKLADFRSETQDSLGKLFGQLETVEQEYVAVKGQLERIDQQPH